jgi:hypothetical protein
MLTGEGNAERRETCLELGARLFLEKPASRDGFAAVFAALDALAEAQPREGFRGVMRRVDLQEVLQLECLSRRSSVLEVFTAQARGRIFISEGAIVHSDYGTLQGEVALYGLLALRGGEFNLSPFVEPPRRTISGSCESLLLEAAQLRDEALSTTPVGIEPVSAAPEPASAPPAAGASAAPAAGPGRRRIEEIVLCSGAGEVIFDWQCKSLSARQRLLDQIEQQAQQLARLIPVGRFDRLEIVTPETRAVCQVHPDRRLFVRSNASEPAS